MRLGGLGKVDAQMEVPAGTLKSSWERHSSQHLAVNFSVPPGSGPATLVVPTLNISRPTVSENETVISKGGKVAAAALLRGLSSPTYVIAGSSVGLQWSHVEYRMVKSLVT